MIVMVWIFGAFAALSVLGTVYCVVAEWIDIFRGTW